MDRAAGLWFALLFFVVRERTLADRGPQRGQGWVPEDSVRPSSKPTIPWVYKWPSWRVLFERDDGPGN